ncbi:MAG: hypothetical protein ACRDPM_09745, partial [Solirubrobacteraceae bacterium]
GPAAHRAGRDRMTGDLEQRLVALGATLELPQAPDVVPAVLARLPARRRRHRLPARRTLAAALAATLLLAGGAMAVPPTRDAILQILGLRGVRIERVPRLPPLPAGAALRLGQRIPLARARHAAGFTARLPPGSPAAYLGHDVPGGRISLLVGRALIIELRGTTTPFIFKVIGPGTTVKRVRVNGGPGVYLSGAPHEVLFQAQTGQLQSDRVRLAGNVLIWQQGRLTIRIEGTRTLGQALALARSLR